SDDLDAVLDVLEGTVPGHNLPSVLGVEQILRLAFSEKTRSVDDEHPIPAGCGLLAAEDHDTPGELRAVEEVGGETDDGLDQVFLQERGADLTLGRSAEKRSLRQDHGHAAVPRRGH